MGTTAGVFYNQFVESKDPLATTALPGQPSEPKSQDLSSNAEPALRAQFLILVVDDSADNVAMLSLDLQQQGYRVVTATNGEEAVSVAIFTRPDLILMDISMPQLDGLAATTKIRAHDALREVPVIAVTAFGTDGFRRAAYDVASMVI
jgi:CheY-like chemotaxis protein